MLSLERRFQQVQDSHFFWSSYTCFANAIYGMGYPLRMMHKQFKKLVDKSDYATRELPHIFKFLDRVSVRVKKEGKLPLGEGQKCE